MIFYIWLCEQGLERLYKRTVTWPKPFMKKIKVAQLIAHKGNFENKSSQ